MTQVLAIAAIILGAGFFLAGTIGLLRFPDTFSRIHALTKADNLGLGFIAAGIILYDPDPLQAARVTFVWLLALISSSTACFLIASRQFHRLRDESE